MHFRFGQFLRIIESCLGDVVKRPPPLCGLSSLSFLNSFVDIRVQRLDGFIERIAECDLACPINEAAQGCGVFAGFSV